MLSTRLTEAGTGMVIIWRRKRLITRLRKQRGLPPIEDPNDLPDPKEAANYVSVRSCLLAKFHLLMQFRSLAMSSWSSSDISRSSSQNRR